MTRIGFADTPESVEEVKKISELPNLEIEGMFTHFARADEYDRSPAMVQLKRYQDFSRRVDEAGVEIPLHHCSNSAGIIRVPEANLSIVRAGITIYGIYPSSEVERDIVKLAPVMELKSHVTYVKDVPAGAAISYGGTYVADKKLRVATIPVGYADGYSRQLSNGDLAIGFFNLKDESVVANLNLDEVGLPMSTGKTLQMKEVWTGEDLPSLNGTVRKALEPYGCAVYRCKVVDL